MSSCKMNFLSRWELISEYFDPRFSPRDGQLEEFFVEREQRLLRKLEIVGRRKSPMLLAGQKGCGKTLLLLTLCSKMKHHYFVVYVDVKDYFSTRGFSFLGFCLCIGQQLCRSFSNEGLELKEDTLLKFESIKSGEGDFSNEHARSDLLDRMIEFINLVNENVQDLTGEDLFLAVDGLDVVSDSDVDFLFKDRSCLTRIKCSVIYTLPYVISLSRRYQELDDFQSAILYNVPLHFKGNENELYVPGYDIVRSVVEKRLALIKKKSEEVFTPEALKRLIKMSGGVMRDMIALVDESLLQAQIKDASIVDLSISELAIKTLRDKKVRGLSVKDGYPALMDIQRGVINQDDVNHRYLLKNSYVVEYSRPDDDAWHSLHPLILEKLPALASSQKELPSFEINLPINLNIRIKRVLLNCLRLKEKQYIESLFLTDPRLEPWRYTVPLTAKSLDERVTQIIAFMWHETDPQGENALLIFLYALRDLASSGEIEELICEFEECLNSGK